MVLFSFFEYLPILLFCTNFVHIFYEIYRNRWVVHYKRSLFWIQVATKDESFSPSRLQSGAFRSWVCQNMQAAVQGLTVEATNANSPQLSQ